MEKKNYSLQTALFRDPVSQRMKASQLVLSKNIEKIPAAI